MAARGVLRLLLLALALISVSGLRLIVGSSRPTAARALARMALPKFDDAKSLSTEEIQAELTTAEKELFELRKKVKTRQQVKPHLFTHTKHRIAQLQTLLSQRQA